MPSVRDLKLDVRSRVVARSLQAVCMEDECPFEIRVVGEDVKSERFHGVGKQIAEHVNDTGHCVQTYRWRNTECRRTEDWEDG